MRETTAVFLGFGTVALGIVAVPIAVFLYGAHAMDQEPANVGSPIGRAFLAVHVASNRPAAPVPAIGGLLSLGMAGESALHDLREDGFDCSGKSGGTLCHRTLRHMSSSEVWSITLTFDTAGRIISRSGNKLANSL